MHARTSRTTTTGPPVTVEATEEGMARPYDIAAVVYEYLAMLRRDLDAAEGARHWEECKTVAECDFRFRPKVSH